MVAVATPAVKLYAGWKINVTLVCSDNPYFQQKVHLLFSSNMNRYHMGELSCPFRFYVEGSAPLLRLHSTTTTVSLKHISSHLTQGSGDSQTVLLSQSLLGVCRQSRNNSCPSVTSGTTGLTLCHHALRASGWTDTNQDWPLYQNQVSANY